MRKHLLLLAALPHDWVGRYGTEKEVADFR